MKKLLIGLLLIASLGVKAQVQYGGVIRAINNAGTIDQIKRTGDALKVNDSAVVSRMPSLVSGKVPVDISSPVAVTGTFWQNIQPVSISGSIAVTGTFWQAVQPVSGTVSVSNFPATQPVSGTFWQATQPVSVSSLPLPTGALTEATFTSEDFATQTTLAAINTKTPALGSATSANSTPVVIASDQGTVNINSAPLTFDGQAAQTATINNIIPATASANATDVTNYKSFSIQIVSTGTGGQFIFEGSNDNTNFQNIPFYNQAALSTGPLLGVVTASSSSIVYIGAINFRYIRVRISSTITGGSIRAFSTFTQETFAGTSTSVINGTAANFVVSAQIGNTANTTPILANGLIPVGANTGDAGAKTATGNGATQTNVNAKGALIVFNLGTVTGTTPTCVFKLQGSSDAGTTWVDLPNAFTASLTATGVYGIQIYPGLASVAGTTTTGTTATVNGALPRTWRVVWTIGGTTPSFTITNVQVTYMF